MQKILPLLAALAAGCSMIAHEKVENWPALEIVEHYVPHAEMRNRCAPYVGFGYIPDGSPTSAGVVIFASSFTTENRPEPSPR